MFKVEEIQKLVSESKNLITTKEVQGKTIPYVDTVEAFKIFNTLTDFNYDFEVVEDKIYEQLGVLWLKCRLTVRKGDIIKVVEAYGSAKLMKARDSHEILNFDSIFKTAETDAFKKILKDFFMIGLEDLGQAKQGIRSGNAPQQQIQRPSGQVNAELKCSDCGRKLTEKIYNYSMQNHGKALCMDCQKKPKTTIPPIPPLQPLDNNDPFLDLIP